MSQNLTIISVLYNSSKWIKGYIESILQSDIKLSKISVILIDNASTDDSITQVKKYEAKLKKVLGNFALIRSDKNHGFGQANNIASKYSNSDFFLFLNIDTEVEKSTLRILFEELEKSGPEIGAWELCQLPYEHPKYYHPVHLTTSWSSGAALVIRKDIFEKVKGFDSLFFMYAEDVDISWKIRMNEYKIKYLPRCRIHHYTYQSFNEIKPNQYYYSLINNLILRLKFGGIKEFRKGLSLFLGILKQKGPFENSRKKLLQKLLNESLKFPKAYLWHIKNKTIINKNPPFNFFGFDYEQQREGAFVYLEKPVHNPLVSFIVRTVGRPNILFETLISLRNQTYSNIEIVVIEDGTNTSQQMIENTFSDLKIQYHSTGKKVGRTKAGNIGLSISTGQYLNFLDDDDLLFADHTEALVSCFERHPEFNIITNWGWEAKTETISTDPYIYSFKTKALIYKRRFNRLRLCMHNFLPIQTVMFNRKVYKTIGGFDEELDMLEDWDLWLRYSLKYKFYTLEKTCSIYKVPFQLSESHLRKTKLDIDYHLVREKQRAFLIIDDPISLTEQFHTIDQ